MEDALKTIAPYLVKALGFLKDAIAWLAGDGVGYINDAIKWLEDNYIEK